MPKYSLGKLWRTVIGKKTGRALQTAIGNKLLDSFSGPSSSYSAGSNDNFATANIEGKGMYTGMGMYTGAGRYKRRRITRRRRYSGRKRVSRANRGYSRRRYSVRKGRYSNNLIRGGMNTNPRARTVNNETGDVIVVHKEYLGDIYGPSNAFNVQSFQLNPGLEATFPWLAQVAQNYEEYAFDQLVFSYRSTVTDIGNSTTGQCGTCIMATNYDPDAKPFYDKGQMLEYVHAMSSKTTESMDHGVECDPKKKNLHRLFVRSGPPDRGSMDLKDYDTGKFQLAIANSPSAYANQSLGELWVYYKVRLSKPKIYTGRGNAISRFVAVSGYDTAVGNQPNGEQMMLNDYIYPSQQNNLAMRLTSNNAGQLTLTWPANAGGAYKVQIVITPMAPTDYVLTAPVFKGPDGSGATAGGSGNIKAIKDLISQDGQPTSVWASAQVGAANPTQDVMSECHVFVTQATNGVNNSIIIDNTAATATSAVFCMVFVEEYNSQGIENPTNSTGPNTGIYQQPLFVQPQTGTLLALTSV